MDLVVKGRGDRVSGQTRDRLRRKLSRLERLESRLDRVEVEVTWEAHRRVQGGHRVDAACRTPRRTYRASATGKDVDGAIDRLVERLERQIVSDHGRRRSRMLDGANRVKSRRSPSDATPSLPPHER
jgi:ribosomal subunit interface protein